MEDELSLFINKTVVTLDMVVLFQPRHSDSIYFKFKMFSSRCGVFQISSKLMTRVSACYGISNVVYLTQGYISGIEN